MSIDDMTIREAREIASIFSGDTTRKPCPFTPGKAYLIRTVTMAWTGRVDRVSGDFLVLTDAAWVASTGRYSQATTPEALDEVEPRDGEVIVGLGAVVDAVEWTAKLPRNQG